MIISYSLRRCNCVRAEFSFNALASCSAPSSPTAFPFPGKFSMRIFVKKMKKHLLLRESVSVWHLFCYNDSCRQLKVFVLNFCHFSIFLIKNLQKLPSSDKMESEVFVRSEVAISLAVSSPKLFTENSSIF